MNHPPRAAASPGFRTVAIVTANLVALALLLLLFEGVIRWTHPEIPPLGTDSALIQDSVYGSAPGLRPNATGTSNGALFHIDESGFVSYAADKPATAPGWLFLGDSVTMGIGVDPDSTFAGILARSSRLNVLNPSLVGYDVRDYRAIFSGLLPPPRRTDREIRRVTVFWCLNDLYLPDIGGDVPGENIRRLTGPFLRFAQRHLRSYQWLKRLVTDRPLAYFRHDLRLYDSARVDSAVAILAAVHSDAQRFGVQFEVVLLPFEAQLRPDVDQATLPQDMMRQALTSRGIPHLDLLPHLRDLTDDPSTLYAYGDGIHFSARGHELIAAHLRHRLRSSEAADSL